MNGDEVEERVEKMENFERLIDALLEHPKYKDYTKGAAMSVCISRYAIKMRVPLTALIETILKSYKLEEILDLGQYDDGQELGA